MPIARASNSESFLVRRSRSSCRDRRVPSACSAATERLGSYGPPIKELWTPNEVARALGLSGARHALDLIGSGLTGSVYSAGHSRLLVRADTVRALADRRPVDPGHPGALVVRVGAARADTEADSGRDFYGWNQAVADTDLTLALEGVRGFYQLSDERANTVVAFPLPVIVTVKGVVATVFIVGGWERHRLGVRFEIAEINPAHPLLAPFAGRRLSRGRGGVISWLPETCSHSP
jgi:hypothetical protein